MILNGDREVAGKWFGESRVHKSTVKIPTQRLERPKKSDSFPSSKSNNPVSTRPIQIRNAKKKEYFCGTISMRRQCD